jgi:hypothetical protein
MKTQTLKNIIICLLLCLFSSLITYYLCRKKCDDISDNTRSLTDVCMDYSTEAPATLTTEMVKSMVTQYGDAQLQSIQSAAVNAVHEDAKSIWFDLETLKAFLYQIEHNALTKDTKIKNENLGVRIYYAAYPDNVKMRAMASSQTDPNFSYNPAYEKHHTLVMIPTISDGEGENYDFNPLDVNTFNGFVNMPKGGVFSANSSSYVTLSLGTSSVPVVPVVPAGVVAGGSATSPGISARNHGTLYPPDNTIGNIFN